MSSVKDLRKAQGMSQQDLADKMGVSREFISMIENGNVRPSFDNIPKMAELLKISSGELIFLLSGVKSSYEDTKQSA